MAHVQYVLSIVILLCAPLLLINPGLQVFQLNHYQPVQYCTYCLVLGSFNNCNNIKLSHRATSSEGSDKIHQAVLDGIHENMDALVQADKYCAINKTNTNTVGYYVIKFAS